MLFSHRFGSVETLSRAQYWLTECGFQIAPTDPETHDTSRLALSIDFSRASAAMALIDSIERSDPRGWPGFLDRPRALHAHAAHRAPGATGDDHAPSSTPIHWHAGGEAHPIDSVSRKMSEYMFSRWE